MGTYFAAHILGPDDHASRPAAGDVPEGSLYSCSDHDLVYQSDGSSWATWIDHGGGGGVSHAYVGKNAIGASFESPTTNRVYAKKIVLANDCLFGEVELYVRQSGDLAQGPVEFSLWDDVGDGSAPDHLLAYWATGPNSLVLLNPTGTGTNDGRWLSGGGPARWLTAATYWMTWTVNASTLQVAYDTGGSDLYHGRQSGHFGVDWGFSNGNWPASADSTRDYSIRASTFT